MFSAKEAESIVLKDRICCALVGLSTYKVQVFCLFSFFFCRHVPL